MPTRCNCAPLKVYIDLIPVVKASKNGFIGRSICASEIAKRLIGEDDTPAICAISAIALYNGDLRFWACLFHQQRKIQPCCSAADTHYAHIKMLLEEL